MRKKEFHFIHVLLVILVAVNFLPDNITKESYSNITIFVGLGIWAIAVVGIFLIKEKNAKNLLLDILSFLLILFIAWALLTAKFNLLKEALFPPPGRVFNQFAQDLPKIIINIKSSLGIIFQGYTLGAVSGIILGLILGWSARLGGVATYISKFLGSIPPIVYIPYGIALLPTFRSVSVFVIFLASFWPILAATMSGVLHVEQHLINSAKVLNLNSFTMLRSIILPASLPEIFIGCNQGLSVSFILLTSAEMIGARAGLGYYVKNYSDLGDYTRTIVGLLVIGIVIVIITFLFQMLQKRLLRWKR